MYIVSFPTIKEEKLENIHARMKQRHIWTPYSTSKSNKLAQSFSLFFTHIFLLVQSAIYMFFMNISVYV